MATLSAVADHPVALPDETVATTVFDTPLGWMAAASTDRCLLRLAFGHRSAAAARWAISGIAAAPDDKLPPRAISGDDDGLDLDIEQLVQQLQAFAAGEPVDLRGVPVDVSHLTPFAQQVVAGCRQLDWGETCSYGELATAAGRPGAARAVGSVMARNRVPLVIPCHRVLGAGGKLGGYSAPDGLAMKRRLLAMEST